MRTLLSLLTVLVWSLSAPAFADDSNWRQIEGEELHKTFDNTTVIGEYRSNRGGIEHYRFKEIHKQDGTTDYIEQGAKTVIGKWQIVGEDKICYRYEGNAVFNQTYCFFIYKFGTCYYNFSINAMSINGPLNWDWWTSRFIRKGEGGTCDVPVS
jgi:hypothetical protein